MIGHVKAALFSQKSYLFPPKIGGQLMHDYISQNPKYLIGAAILVTGGTQVYQYLKKVLTEKRIAELKINQRTKLQQLFKNIDDYSLTTMYEMWKPLPLYIPGEDADKIHDIDALKQLFHAKSITPGVDFLAALSFREWDENDWENELTTLKKRSKKIASKNSISIDQVSTLLNDAKTILKSFVLTDRSFTDILFFIENQFIKKSGLNRLFTYAKLQKVIEQENLNHVHLPLKMLIIKNIKTGKYISSKEAEKLIDNTLKAYTTSGGDIWIDFYSDEYQPIIFAHKQIRSSAPLSQKAYDELKELCTRVPFDVGQDNIFTDVNGDAVIIDTEFKGESAESSVPKLDRYYNPGEINI
jgi:hypothetical protein